MVRLVGTSMFACSQDLNDDPKSTQSLKPNHTSILHGKLWLRVLDILLIACHCMVLFQILVSLAALYVDKALTSLCRQLILKACVAIIDAVDIILDLLKRLIVVAVALYLMQTLVSLGPCVYPMPELIRHR